MHGDTLKAEMLAAVDASGDQTGAELARPRSS